MRSIAYGAYGRFGPQPHSHLGFYFLVRALRGPVAGANLKPATGYGFNKTAKKLKQRQVSGAKDMIDCRRVESRGLRPLAPRTIL